MEDCIGFRVLVFLSRSEIVSLDIHRLTAYDISALDSFWANIVAVVSKGDLQCLALVRRIRTLQYYIYLRNTQILT